MEQTYAYKIPDKFSSKNAAPLMCAGVIGYRSLSKVGLQPGESLGLYGFGVIRLFSYLGLKQGYVVANMAICIHGCICFKTEKIYFNGNIIPTLKTKSRL